MGRQLSLGRQCRDCCPAAGPAPEKGGLSFQKGPQALSQPPQAHSGQTATCPHVHRLRLWCQGASLFSFTCRHLSSSSSGVVSISEEGSRSDGRRGPPRCGHVAMLPALGGPPGRSLLVGPTEPGLGVCPDGLQRAPRSKVETLAPLREMDSLQPACVSLRSALLSPGVFTEMGVQCESTYRHTRHPLPGGGAQRQGSPE